MGASHAFSINDLLCTENETSLFDYDNDDLLCTENETSLFDHDNDDGDVVVITDVEAEFVKILLDREPLNFRSNKNGEILCFDSWIRFSRPDIIDWVLKTSDVFGFKCQTAYLCMAYFDKFLSMRSIDRERVWVIRLLSIACLSLAAKMEECKVPPLSMFRMGHIKFQSKVVQKMELYLFKTLEWKLNLITPFVYLPYFVTTLSLSSPTSSLVSKSSQLIIDVMKDINLINYRPSVIAAAAVVMVLEHTLTRKEMESRMSGAVFHGYLDTEDIFTCYSIMQNLDTSGERRAFNLSSTPDTPLSDFQTAFDSPEDFFVATVVPPARSQKRKRLAYNDDDLDGQPPSC